MAASEFQPIRVLKNECCFIFKGLGPDLSHISCAKKLILADARFCFTRWLSYALKVDCKLLPTYYRISWVSMADYKINNLGSGCGSVGRAVASIPEVCGLNPVISKHLYWTFTVNCIEKTKIKKKRPRMAHF